ncbi:DUF3267 domain-containing protein [Virgibacillus ainsalahensis]
MNCWKSINLNKEFGKQRLYFVSFLISLSAFIVLYVPASIIHHMKHVNEGGFILFLLALFLLPAIHAFMHILPLILMKRRVKVIYRTKYKLFPIINYYTKFHLTKKASIITAIAPTILLTVPGLAASYLMGDYYFYLLLLTSIHIGISFIDFIQIYHILKAPKKAYIDNRNNDIDILF